MAFIASKSSLMRSLNTCFELEPIQGEHLKMSKIMLSKAFDYFRFLGSDNHDSYFTTTQRSRIVWEILTTAAYGKRKHAEIGVERLLEEEVYVAAFPLHDVS